jgi:replicative DNA helicase
MKLTNGVVSSANLESHILVLAENYLKREMIGICHESFSKSYLPETDVFDLISSTDDRISKAQEKVVKGMSKDIAFYGAKVLEQHSQVKKTGVLGIKTGILDLDRATNGLVSPDLIIIAARPGAGKTALSLSIIYNTSVLGNTPCAIFSLEMDGVQLVRRLTSIDTSIPHEKIRNGHTTNEEELILAESVEKIVNSKIFIEDKTSMNIRDIRTKASILKKKHNIGYIIVDYIQLMSGVDSKGKNREQIVSDISRGLKCIAKELEIPVIALSQLSRGVETRTGSKKPMLSDLRDSGQIEQDADMVLFCFRPEYYELTEYDCFGKTLSAEKLFVLIIAKHRNGQLGEIPLTFIGENTLISNYYRENELYYNEKSTKNSNFDENSQALRNYQKENVINSIKTPNNSNSSTGNNSTNNPNSDEFLPF